MSRISFGSSVVLGVAILAGAYMVGRGIERWATKPAVATVKGLAEKIVQSDQGIWVINFKASAKNAKDAQAEYNVSLSKVHAFLKKYGFEDAEITSSPPSFIEAENASDPHKVQRVSLEGGVVVKSLAVKKMEDTYQHLFELSDQGVAFTRGSYSSTTNMIPTYAISNFDSWRPGLLEEALKSAHEMGKKFSQTTGSTLGAIKSFSQGQYTIVGADGGNEWEADRSLQKKVRLVVTVTYNLD